MESVHDKFVIYFCREDSEWVAHSLKTDQIGTGPCVVDAIADLMQGLKNLSELHQKDPDIEIFRDAPEEIQLMQKNAKNLDKVIMEIAYKRFLDQLECDSEEKLVNLNFSPNEKLVADYDSVLA